MAGRQIGLRNPKGGGGGSREGEPQVLQEMELLIKWLLPKAWEMGAVLLKEMRSHYGPRGETAGLP